MDETKSFHMTPEEFRKRGRQFLDWLPTTERVELPVLSRVEPVRSARLPKTPPEAGEPFDAMLRDLDQIVHRGSRIGSRPASSPTPRCQRA
jgi:aromatic-L-amino-acid decarboxylase